ncbi:MAG: hypothetical protein J6Y62_01855 [Clostridia bacterium]|nr:hypothetical protein [Clostridia bacterium]
MKYGREIVSKRYHPFMKPAPFERLVGRPWLEWRDPFEIRLAVEFLFSQPVASELKYEIRFKDHQTVKKGAVGLSYDLYMQSLRTGDVWTEEIFCMLESRLEEEVSEQERARRRMVSLGYEECPLPFHGEGVRPWGFLRVAGPGFLQYPGSPEAHYEVGYFQETYAEGALVNAVVYRMVDREDDWTLESLNTIGPCGQPMDRQAVLYERRPLKEELDKDSKGRLGWSFSWADYLAFMPEPLRMEVVESE